MEKDELAFQAFQQSLHESGIDEGLAFRGAQHFCPGYSADPPLTPQELAIVAGVLNGYQQQPTRLEALVFQWREFRFLVHKYQAAFVATTLIAIACTFAADTFVFAAFNHCPVTTEQSK